jgi:hypothetical protein
MIGSAYSLLNQQVLFSYNDPYQILDTKVPHEVVIMKGRVDSSWVPSSK